MNNASSVEAQALDATHIYTSYISTDYTHTVYMILIAHATHPTPTGQLAN